jgi:hypothetical protein
VGIKRQAIVDSEHAAWFQFVEAPPFTRFREDYLDDDGFAELQNYLAKNPEAGDMVPVREAFARCAGRIVAAARAGAADYGLFTTAFSPNRKFGC